MHFCHKPVTSSLVSQIFFQRHIFSCPQSVFFSQYERLKFHTRTKQEVHIYFNIYVFREEMERIILIS
jgi:hypothetical protein